VVKIKNKEGKSKNQKKNCDGGQKSVCVCVKMWKGSNCHMSPAFSHFDYFDCISLIIY
jgi:hypothetical protein